MPSKIYNDAKKAVIELWRNNIPVREISSRTGTPIRTVQRWNKDEQEKRETLLRTETRELLMEGVSQAQIAIKHNVSQATIYYRIKKWGLRPLVEDNFKLANERKMRKLEEKSTNRMSVYQRAKREDKLKNIEDTAYAQFEVKHDVVRQNLERRLNKVYTDINYLTRLIDRTGGHHHHELTVGNDEWIMKIGKLFEASLRVPQLGEIGARYFKKMVDALSAIVEDAPYDPWTQERIDKCRNAVEGCRAEIRRFDKLVRSHLILLKEMRRSKHGL